MATCTPLSPATASIRVFDEGWGTANDRKLKETGEDQKMSTTTLGPTSDDLDVLGMGKVLEAPAVGKGERVRTKHPGANKGRKGTGKKGERNRGPGRRGKAKGKVGRDRDKLEKDLGAFQFESVADDVLSSNDPTDGDGAGDGSDREDLSKHSNEEEAVLEVVVGDSKVDAAAATSPSGLHNKSSSRVGLAYNLTTPGIDKAGSDLCEGEKEKENRLFKSTGNGTRHPEYGVDSGGQARDDQDDNDLTRQMKSAYKGVGTRLLPVQEGSGLTLVRVFEIVYFIAIVYMELT